jgi:phosphate uptake regulator
MLKEIFKALRRTDRLAEMISQLGQMLDICREMLELASTVLMREVDWPEVADGLYSRDRQVNEIEQTIREQIVTHLSVSPSGSLSGGWGALGNKADLSGCLILMSVVKDAERIGDYCKNIFEVGKFFRGAYAHPEYAETLERIRQDLVGSPAAKKGDAAAPVPLFESAKNAFMDADRQLARLTLDIAGELRGRCDVVIRQLLTVHEQLAPDEAVAYVLLARFYKRVAAHLANIATSVVSPVPMLDYRGKKMPEPEDG